MTLVVSWGGLGSNAYISWTAADSIIQTTAVDATAWTSATTVKQNAAIIQATRDIDSKNYIGARYYFDQTLEFPRQLRSTFPWDRTLGTSILGDVDQARMKRDVEEATALQALYILRNAGRNTHLENIQAGLQQSSEAIGPIKRFFGYAKGANINRVKYSTEAMDLLSDYMVGRNVYRG